MSDKSHKRVMPVAGVGDHRTWASNGIPQVEEYQGALDRRLGAIRVKWLQISQLFRETSGVKMEEQLQEDLAKCKTGILSEYQEDCKAYTDAANLSDLEKARRKADLAQHEREMWKKERPDLLKQYFENGTKHTLKGNVYFFSLSGLLFGIQAWASDIGYELAYGKFLWGATIASLTLVAGNAVIQRAGENWLTSATLWYRERKATRNVRTLEQEQEKAKERKSSESQKLGEDVVKLTLLATLMTVIGLRKKEDAGIAKVQESGVKSTLTGDKSELKRDVTAEEKPSSRKLRIGEMGDKGGTIAAIAVERIEVMAPASRNLGKAGVAADYEALAEEETVEATRERAPVARLEHPTAAGTEQRVVKGVVK